MTTSRRLGLPGLLLAAALALASCGDDGAQGTKQGGEGATTQAAPETTGGGMPGMQMGGATGGTGAGTSGAEEMARGLVAPDGEYSDAAFVDAMVPHHEGAVEMAEVALDNAEHEELRALARQIIAEQRAEIEEFGRLRDGLGGPSTSTSCGEMDAMMGMPEDPQALAEKWPFDRAFIDAMTAHHDSAIAMAKVSLEESENPEIRGIAEGIVSSQERENALMREWREEWYPEG